MDQENLNLTVSCSPHVHAADGTRDIMLDVVIALIPAMLGAVYFFGLRSLCVMAVSVAACVVFEYLYRKLLKKDTTVGDCSAIVTGVLLAMVCPVTIPYWTIIIGDFFAIVVVKQLFGGIGCNFLNPALAGRAFLFSYPVIMTTWVAPYTSLNLIGSNADAVTAATPMSYLHQGMLPDTSVLYSFIGSVGGCLGETSALALLIGFAYLLIRGVISWHTPVCFVGTVFVMSLILGQDAVGQILSGGLMLGAIFMATDYSTTPSTDWGRVLFGIGAGLLTVLIRFYGAYAEGVSFAILFMNILTPYLSKWTETKPFGGVAA